MSQGKIEFSFGSFKFVGEGDEKWLETQLDKVIEKATALSKVQAPAAVVQEQKGSAAPKSEVPFKDSLASYIKAQGADQNQVRRFLATADWLRRRGNTSLSTAMVSKALTENQQKRLSNPADCLNQNVGKGFCEKTSDGFFITPDGLTSLGHSE